jgi:uroporphyrinogen-III synthase
VALQPEQPADAPLLLVTRPQPQADDWVARLAALGVAARALPLLDIAAAPDPAAVATAWAGLVHQDLAMFVSPSAVERFFAARPPELAWPSGLLAGSTGPGTQAALLRAGVPAEVIVSPPEAEEAFDSEALWRVLQGRRDWRGRGALIVRGAGGRPWLAETLRQHGATVHTVEAYRRTAPVLGPAALACLRDALERPAGHLWLFSSSEAVQQLPTLAPQVEWGDARALATHPRIAETARALGFGRVEPVVARVEAVAAHLTPSIQSPRP